MADQQGTDRNMNGSPELVSLVDPYVYQTLSGIVGSTVVVQTIKDTVRGKLMKVLPDHVVVAVDGSSFFVRIQQIIWVLPQK